MILENVVLSANTGADAIKRAPIVEEDTGLKCLRIGDVSQKRDYEMWGFTRTTPEDYTRFKLEKNDIIIARTGNTIGVNCIISDDLNSVYNNGLIRIKADTNKVIPRYLWYLIRCNECQEYIQSIAYGTSTQPNMKIRDFLKFSFKYLDIESQKKIIGIIDALDCRINLNKSINDNLEQQAQALFKSWFLDYDPWGGIVPDSWIDSKLGDFADIRRGGSPRPIQEYLSDSGLRWLKISDVTSLQTPFVIDIKDHIIEEGLKKTVFLKAGSLVLSNSATPGVPKILDVDSCIHDGWLYFPESKFSKEYLYLYFKYIRQQLVNLSNGSVFNNLKTDILKGYPTILPDSETLRRFDDVVKPMFLQMQNLTRESHKLADMRDVILPQLMSGELDVSNLDL